MHPQAEQLLLSLLVITLLLQLKLTMLRFMSSMSLWRGPRLVDGETTFVIGQATFFLPVTVFVAAVTECGWYLKVSKMLLVAVLNKFVHLKFFPLIIFRFLVSQKIGFASFNGVWYTNLFVWLIAIIITGVTGSGLPVLLIPMFFSLFLSLSLRMAVVRRERITECGDVGECCCGFWCWYCSVAQSESLL